MQIFKDNWKEIEGYDGAYLISNDGRVYSRVRKHAITRTGLRKLSVSKDGYLYTSFSKNDKCKIHRIHVLVAKAFIPNPNNYPEVNHKNGIKSDNRVENLEWCTHDYNMKHASANKLMRGCRGIDNNKSKLSELQVLEIREKSKVFKTKLLAFEYGVHTTTIHRINNGKYWKHLKNGI